MARRLRVRVIKRREIDEDKLVLAFLMLAKQLCEEDAESAGESAPGDQEAAR